MRGETVRTDLIAGITVALVFIPQSMTYAHVPAWGSSAQLARAVSAAPPLATRRGSRWLHPTGVIGLIDFAAIKHAWQMHKHDGIAACDVRS